MFAWSKLITFHGLHLLILLQEKYIAVCYGNAGSVSVLDQKQIFSISLKMVAGVTLSK